MINVQINDTTVLDKKTLEENGIDIEDSDRVLAKDENENLYLVSTF